VKLTNRQTSEQTTADMYRAMDRHHPVTLTYVKADGSETIRTVEIYAVQTTSKGHVIVKAMDRQTGEARTFRIDRIEAYTTHRTAYIIARPADASAAPIFTAPAALTAYELARDEAALDRRYWEQRDAEPAADYDTAA
jgi:predicted DNA-binding transcriptional regulator YafY